MSENKPNIQIWKELRSLHEEIQGLRSHVNWLRRDINQFKQLYDQRERDIQDWIERTNTALAAYHTPQKMSSNCWGNNDCQQLTPMDQQPPSSQLPMANFQPAYDPHQYPHPYPTGPVMYPVPYPMVPWAHPGSEPPPLLTFQPGGNAAMYIYCKTMGPGQQQQMAPSQQQEQQPFLHRCESHSSSCHICPESRQ